MGFQRACIFGYKATWKRANGSVVAENCLQSEPTWMNDHHDVIKDLKIRDAVVPGSHDSGSYTKSGDLNTQYLLVPSSPRRRIFSVSFCGVLDFLTSDQQF